MKRCPVCDTIDKWTNIDRLRVKKSEMLMCDECGFVTYPSAFKSQDEIKEYYRKEYRPAPQANNMFTGERKLQYHAYFLTPLFQEWRKAGVMAPVIGEVGSAMGMFLNWIKQEFPEADIHGTELTDTFRRVAFHEYGIKLVEEFDTTKKYDLITSYHVLEHQPEPDKRLAEYASCLKDSGLFYLSVPIWFREASNGAAGGFDIEYHWHTDHINAWADEHVDFVIAKAGLEILMKNNNVYGNTYLLKKTTKTTMKPTFDKNKYLDSAERIYKVWELLQENKTADAIQVYKNCPAAWVNHYEFNRAQFHKSKDEFNKFFADANEACPNSSDIPNYTGDVFSRYERYEEALNHFEVALSRKPNNPTILMGMANCYHMLAERAKDQAVKEDYLRKGINLYRFVMATSTEMMPQALSWSYQLQSKLPVPL